MEDKLDVDFVLAKKIRFLQEIILRKYNIMKEVEIIINILTQKAGKPVRAITSDFITVSLANIICDVTLGKRFDWNDNDFLTILNSIDITAINANAIGLLTVFPFLAKLPGDPFRFEDKNHSNRI